MFRISLFDRFMLHSSVSMWLEVSSWKRFLTTSTLYGTPLMRIIPPGMQQISVISSTISLTTLPFFVPS